MNRSTQKVTSQSNIQEQITVVICGLNAAGKTTVSHVIKHGEAADATYSPSIGINFEKITIGNLTMTALDLGGRGSMRTMWQRYYETARAIIFVVDSNYRDRMEQTRQELHRLINEPELKSKPLLILANKQDLPNAMTIDELRDKLALSELDENLKWHLQATSAIRNQGLKEGFEWLASLFVPKPKTNFMTLAIEIFDDLKKLFNKFMQF